MSALNTNNGLEWFASGNAPLLYPVELVLGFFLFDDQTILEIPPSVPFAAAWGKPVSTRLSYENTHPVPEGIAITWFSIVENKFYAVLDGLPKEQIATLLSEKDEKTKKPKYHTLVAGMAPGGKVAIWVCGNGITTEVIWLKGHEVEMEIDMLDPDTKLSREEYAKKALADCKEAAENFQTNGLPDPMLFDGYMQKFNYRIIPKFENAELEGIELFYFNGELNTMRSGEHSVYNMRAKPQKIGIFWRTGKKQYSGYFWPDERKIIQTFCDCYVDDEQIEGNLIIQADASNKEFRFFLQTADASMEIPAEDMEYIIFKNKFEFHRSAHYKKPSQAWRN